MVPGSCPELPVWGGDGVHMGPWAVGGTTAGPEVWPLQCPTRPGHGDCYDAFRDAPGACGPGSRQNCPGEWPPVPIRARFGDRTRDLGNSVLQSKPFAWTVMKHKSRSNDGLRGGWRGGGGGGGLRDLLEQGGEGGEGVQGRGGRGSRGEGSPRCRNIPNPQ